MSVVFCTSNDEVQILHRISIVLEKAFIAKKTFQGFEILQKMIDKYYANKPHRRRPPTL